MIQASEKSHASPRLPSRVETVALNRNTALPTFATARGVSPNVTKRLTVSQQNQPSTPQHQHVSQDLTSPPQRPLSPAQTTDHALEHAARRAHQDRAADNYIAKMQEELERDAQRSAEIATYLTMEDAIEILEGIAQSSESINDAAQCRSMLLKERETTQIYAHREHEQQQLAYLQHMHETVQSLNDELVAFRERAASSNSINPSSESVASPPTAAWNAMPASNATNYTMVKRNKALSPALSKSPLLARLGAPGNSSLVLSENSPRDNPVWLCKSADTRIRAKALKSSQDLVKKSRLEIAKNEIRSIDAVMISSREGKLRGSMQEKVYWQNEYELMREQVVNEKMRQVELFRRLESSKREHFAQADAFERALKDLHVENEVLKSQLAEARTLVSHQKRRVDEVLRHAQEDKDKLVCSIAETRHKFKEWKEGEAATLKAARDQAVHNLKTEYELKIARHHEEKQKLRDKIKDLEVSLRLLQKDRNLSPQELSLRKASILNNRENGSTTEAELIEATCRIKELEALLDHAKEHRKRQEHIIHISEATISRLVQEREVVALESLSQESVPGLRLQIPSSDMRQHLSTPSVVASALAMTPINLGDPLGAEGPGTLTMPLESLIQTRRSSVVGQKTFSGSHSISEAVPPGSAIPLTTPAAAAAFAVAITGSPLKSTDPEKEVLRRQSIVLSAEVEKYRQIVVHSLDEIRVLKDNRRRSHHGMIAANGQSVAGSFGTSKEQYLLNELGKVQSELEALQLKVRQSKKRRRKVKKKQQYGGITQLGNEGESSDDSSCVSSSENSNSSSSDSSSETDAADENESKDKPQPHGDPPDEMAHTPEIALSVVHAGITFERSPIIAESRITDKDSKVSSDRQIRILSEKASAAVQVIQTRLKAYVVRLRYVRQKRAIDRIKAQYKGYLVRKTISDPLDTGRALQRSFLVTEAMQVKMQIIDPHLVMTAKCRGQVFRLEIRISKDPPIVKVQMQAEHDPLLEPFDLYADTGVHIYFVHLFEVIALLPQELEAMVLEQATERAIAKIIGLALQVVHLNGEYRLMVNATKKYDAGSKPTVKFATPAPANSGRILTNLAVQEIAPPEREPGNTIEAAARLKADVQDLDDLIREVRLNPTVDLATAADSSPQLGPPGRNAPQLMRRWSSQNSLVSIPEGIL